MLDGIVGRIAFFALGILAAVALCAGASIYGFDYYEPHWGRGISFQVSLWIGIVLAVVGAIGFAVGVRVFHAAPTRLLAFAAGVLVAGVSFVSTTVADRVASATGTRQLILAGIVLALSFAASLPLRGECGSRASRPASKFDE